ncbi:Fe-S cluster assembly protein SufD [Porphyromonadaceae bacterium W3.11]|nr:Fe-S cluster assembly protein SufD [Porphyromonadaceae bacterium W3.11]
MKEDITRKYLDLFARSEREITTHSPDLLNKYRSEAIKELENDGLPRYRNEDYQRFKIDQEIDQDRSQHQVQKDSNLNLAPFSCRLTYPDTIQCFIIEGKVFTPNKGDNFFIGSISEFEETYPGIAEKYYNKILHEDNDRISSLNTLFATDALVYYIPKGVKQSKPIHLIHYPNSEVENENSPLSFPRILWIAEEDSKSSLLLCDHATKDQSTYIGVMEVYAEKNAELQYYNIEETSTDSLRIFNTHIHQNENSTVLVDNMTIKNGKTRNNFYCNLHGKDAHLDLDGLGILDDEQLLDNWSIIRHHVPSCHSDELFKYTINDKAVGSFSGLIYVAPDAQKTLAYQNNKNLILADSAKMYSKPQLEIYADDVKCSHGMTTGELNESAIFYMQQRGIPYVEAKLLLTIAFMSDVLDKIDVEPLRDRLYTVIENRYRGLPGRCSK